MICKVPYRDAGFCGTATTPRSNPVHSPAHPSFPNPFGVSIGRRLPTHHRLSACLSLFPSLFLSIRAMATCQPVLPTGRQYSGVDKPFLRPTTFGAISRRCRRSPRAKEAIKHHQAPSSNCPGGRWEDGTTLDPTWRERGEREANVRRPVRAAANHRRGERGRPMGRGVAGAS